VRIDLVRTSCNTALVPHQLHDIKQKVKGTTTNQRDTERLCVTNISIWIEIENLIRYLMANETTL
jgi:hypothetical protein